MRPRATPAEQREQLAVRAPTTRLGDRRRRSLADPAAEPSAPCPVRKGPQRLRARPAALLPYPLPHPPCRRPRQLRESRPSRSARVQERRWAGRGGVARNAESCLGPASFAARTVQQGKRRRMGMVRRLVPDHPLPRKRAQVGDQRPPPRHDRNDVADRDPGHSAQPFDRNGPAGAPVVIASSSVQRASGFPQMVRDGGGLLFAWTDTAEPAQVRTAYATLR